MSAARDTIAAISTPPGQGGIGVVRISGPDARAIGTVICGQSPQPRRVTFASFLDADQTVIDAGIVLFFANPGSYTGEDTLELQGHGGPAVLELLMQRVVSLGARLARPGEFTERAFLNDKLDLAQAEAVSDLIASGSAAAARAAVRSLNGVFSERVHIITRELIDLRVYIEAALDFAEEEIDFLCSVEMQDRVARLQQKFSELHQQVQHGRVLREGMTVVIAGAPNAGKSSLLNCLSGQDSAIVTDVAGTTRDVLREHILIDGMPVHLVDTAGLHKSTDPVEQEGIRRALKEIDSASRVLWLLDSAEHSNINSLADLQGFTDADYFGSFPQHLPIDLVLNKTDISGIAASRLEEELSTHRGERSGSTIRLSARTGEGVDCLKSHLKKVAGFIDDNESSFIARTRHLESVRRASHCVNAGFSQLDNNNAELAAEDFRNAQNALSEITGEFSSDDLLGEIFSSFCIGK